MKKAIPIAIGVLGILIAGVFIGFQVGDILTPAQIRGIDFDPADIQFLTENVEFITEITTDDDGVETIGKKTGVRVPIKYNFPVLDEETGDYVVKEIDGAMEMTFDGYNMCRQKGGTKNQCLQELRDDIESNVQTFQINVKRELEEFKQKQFQEELEILETL